MSGALFNAEWYVRNNPDVEAAVNAGLIDPWTHFEQFGRAEGRSPSAQFDPEHYIAENPDVADAVQAGQTTAYDHFISYGATEGRSFVPYFDKAFYLSQNPDVRTAVEAGQTTAVGHFLGYGRTEARALNPFINLAAYLDANLDVKAAVEAGEVDPLSHLLTNGVQEGRDLGNGVSLAQFASDPKFQEAIGENGDPLDAIARVSEVAPFLKTFEAPEGWQAPKDTPIPTDFVPVGDEKLVIPPTVEVPEGVELPPEVFEPVEPGEPGEPQEPIEIVVEYNTELSDFATTEGGAMMVGTGNLATNFAVNEVELERPEGWTAEEAPVLEIGLGAQQRGGAVYTMDDEGVIEVGAGEIPTFKFSVATNSSESLEDLLTTYDIRLKVDTDPTAGTNFITLNAVASDEDTGGALNWDFVPSAAFTDDNYLLTDDGGTAKVSQNIQALSWYQPQDGGSLFGPTGTVEAGLYDVQLEVWHGEGEGIELVGATGIQFNVEATPSA